MNDKHLDVLEQYGFTVETIRRGRGAWICETSEGWGLLKEYRGTARRLEFEDQVLTALAEKKEIETDRYLRTSEGGLFSIAEDGTRYVMKTWFGDRECSLRDSREVCLAAGKIAELHKILRRIPWNEEWNMGSIVAESPEKELERHNREMRKARNFIKNKRKKSEFELCVVQTYDTFYKQAAEACQGMAALFAGESVEPGLCHGELDQHHILIGEHGIAITDYNRMHLGIQIRDLYRFMRKAMEKHQWAPSLGISILKAYEEVLPMTEKEKKCLYYLFLYPEKYWKQLNYYYNSNKAWIPQRNTEKLYHLEEQQSFRNAFLSEIR